MDEDISREPVEDMSRKALEEYARVLENRVASLEEKLEDIVEDGETDHDLSYVKNELDAAEQEWDSSLPDDPTDLTDN